MDYFLSTHWQASCGLLLGMSSSASSYRAELLGLCSLHLLAQALFEFYKVSGWEATLCCDNLCALQLSSQDRRRIKPSAACSVLHRSLRSTKNNFTGCFKYQHVIGQVSSLAPVVTSSTTQRRVRHHSKGRSPTSHNNRIY